MLMETEALSFQTLNWSG